MTPNGDYVGWLYDAGVHGSYTRGAEIFSISDVTWDFIGGYGYGVDGFMFEEYGPLILIYKGNILIDQLIYQHAERMVR